MKEMMLKSFIFGLVGTLLILFYQNCSKVNFRNLPKESSKVQGNNPNIDDLGDPELGDDPELVDGPLPIDEVSDLDPREIHCQSMKPGLASAIVYDSRTLTGSADVSYGQSAGSLKVDAENISSISGFAGLVHVTASSIDTVSGVASSGAIFNVQSIGKIHGFAGLLEVTTHSFESANSMAADMCLSAQTVGTLSGLGARLSLYGRNEDGKKATVESISGVASFLSAYDIDFKNGISGTAIMAKFVNSHIPRIDGSAVDIILVDSTIDEISHSSGRIVLKGNSKVLQYNSSSIVIENQ